MSTTSSDTLALETIELLETRLQRIQYYATGQEEPEVLHDIIARGKGHGIQTRLQQLEEALRKLASKSRVVSELLLLYQTHPDIFPPMSTANDEAFYSKSERLAIVESCATLFSLTSSRLTSMQDLPVPPAESSAHLVKLQPRLAKVELLQDSQAEELANLRLRSAAAVKRFYETGVLGSGDCWTEWEERCMDVEKLVRREEASRANEALGI